MQRIENMPRPEIILVADTVAREKNIDKEDVFEAMEIAIQKAARSKYGFEHDIRATIDRKPAPSVWPVTVKWLMRLFRRKAKKTTVRM